MLKLCYSFIERFCCQQRLQDQILCGRALWVQISSQVCIQLFASRNWRRLADIVTYRKYACLLGSVGPEKSGDLRSTSSFNAALHKNGLNDKLLHIRGVTKVQVPNMNDFLSLVTSNDRRAECRELNYHVYQDCLGCRQVEDRRKRGKSGIVFGLCQYVLIHVILDDCFFVCWNGRVPIVLHLQ